MGKGESGERRGQGWEKSEGEGRGRRDVWVSHLQENHAAGTFSHTQTVEEAGKFFQRRMDYVTKHLETLQKTLLEKCKMREGMYVPRSNCSPSQFACSQFTYTCVSFRLHMAMT